MSFKNLRINIYVRIAFLLATIFLLAYVVFVAINEVNAFFLSLLLVTQIYLLVQALDKTNKEIASELFISLSTVKTHINNLNKKLNVTSRKELKRLFLGF